MTPSLYDVLTLGIRTYGNSDSDSHDGIYELNGVTYIVTGNTVVKESDVL